MQGSEWSRTRRVNPQQGPGTLGALARLIDHVQGHEGVWIASRESIARHWHARFPPPLA